MGVMEKDGSIVNYEEGIDPKELEDYMLVLRTAHKSESGMTSALPHRKMRPLWGFLEPHPLRTTCWWRSVTSSFLQLVSSRSQPTLPAR